MSPGSLPLVLAVGHHVSWNSMKAPSGVLIPLLCLAVLSPANGGGRKSKPDADEGKNKPRLSLTADPAFGFTPVTVTFTGHLTGVDLHDRNFCHAAVTLVRIEPGQSERDSFKIREDPACVHPDEEISVADSFS